MNRELKFRGKRIDKNEWIYGGLSYTQNKDKYFINTFDSSGFLIMLEVEPKSVGQFVANINNIELFENDYIKCLYQYHTGTDSDFEGIIEYIEVYRGFAVCKKEEAMPLTSEYNVEFFEDSVELIGNTTDSPELLECVL